MKPTTAASAVEPSAFLAMPIATPMQNSSGRPNEESSSALPAALKTLATLSQPRPSSPKMSGWPNRFSRPAAGSTATGS